MTADPSEFERDVELLTEMIRADARPSPEQIEAAARVFRHTIVNLAGIAESLRRIADAQQRMAGTGDAQRQAAIREHRAGGHEF